MQNIQIGEVLIDLTLKRTAQGLVVNIKAHESVEETIRAMGNGTQILPVTHGRLWGGEAPLRAWAANDEVPACLRPLGATLMTEHAGANIAFLRLVGITQGITFTVAGVYSFEYLKSLQIRLRTELRDFYQEQIKPIEFGVKLVIQELR